MPTLRALSASSAERAAREIEHGRRICARAEEYWGWTTLAGQRRAARRARLLIEHGRITADTCCLEVGCGTGLFTAALARTGARIDAIDISPDLLAKAHERIGCEKVQFILGNVEKGEGLGRYDAVVGVSVLHHLDLSLALPELIKRLKPGGRFVFTEPNLRNPQIWLQKNIAWLKHLLGDSPDETALRRHQVIRMFQHQGLVGVSARPFDWLHPWTPKPLIQFVTVLGSILEEVPLVSELGGSLLIVARKPLQTLAPSEKT